jgi:hypothetical protein
MRQLIDLRDVTQASVTPDDLLAAAAYMPLPPDTRRAAIAPTDLAFGLVRMAASLYGLDTDRLAIVRTLDEAIAYLDVPDLAGCIEAARTRPDWSSDATRRASERGRPDASMRTSPVDNQPAPTRLAQDEGGRPE